MGKRPELSPFLTATEFDNGYWYATELQAFARELGVPSALKLRKMNLRQPSNISWQRRDQSIDQTASHEPGCPGRRQGLTPELPIVNYTDNKERKDFILREAQELDADFKRKSGTRHLLNRWREEQIAKGNGITYGDLVNQAIVLDATKAGPLRVEHGRYVNFISDFMARE